MPTGLELFERRHVAVYRFLRRMAPSREDAEDLTQEVFVRVLQALDSYQDKLTAKHGEKAPSAFPNQTLPAGGRAPGRDAARRRVRPRSWPHSD
jgi:hypothetical protein